MKHGLECFIYLLNGHFWQHSQREVVLISVTNSVTTHILSTVSVKTNVRSNFLMKENRFDAFRSNK